jgi:hypothetical protein
MLHRPPARTLVGDECAAHKVEGSRRQTPRARSTHPRCSPPRSDGTAVPAFHFPAAPSWVRPAHAATSPRSSAAAIGMLRSTSFTSCSVSRRLASAQGRCAGRCRASPRCAAP